MTSKKTVTVSEPLEPHGDRYYRTQSYMIGTCDGVQYQTSNLNTVSLGVVRPARPDYSNTGESLTYMSGLSGNYRVTDDHEVSGSGLKLVNALSLKLGAAATWALLQSGPVVNAGGNYAALSCTTCTNPTLTALHSSDACEVYNVQVKTSYGGFLSQPLYVSIERPWKAVKPDFWEAFDDEDYIDDDGPTTSQGFYAVRFYAAEGLCGFKGFLNAYQANEAFTGLSDPVTNNWIYTAFGFSVNSGAWYDTVAANPGNWCGPSGTATCDPVPELYSSPLSTTLIDSADQRWRIGSLTPGAGTVIQKNKIERYMDNGKHTGIVSPSN